MLTKHRKENMRKKWGRPRRAILLAGLLLFWGLLYAALPTINSPVPDFIMFEGQTQDITIKATDADGDSLVYELVQSPGGMTLTDSIISWTPNYSQAGTDTVIYKVYEAATPANSVSDTFVVTVLDAGMEDAYDEVSASLGLDSRGVTNSVAWADYDNDGETDVFLANGGGPGALYRGSGGTYSLSGDFPGATGQADASSAAWADYNHDGRLDLYVASLGLFGGSKNHLYCNTDSGFFDVTDQAGVGNRGQGTCVNWVDFDTDGDPDIYIVNYGEANELYSNNGNGTFTAVGDTAGVANTGDGVASAWCDYDADGDPDLYVVNENGANVLFSNDGDSTFTDVSTTAGVGHTGRGAVAAWGDYDNDGDFDLFLANKDSVHVLFSNNGSGTFTRVGSGLALRGTARSATWLDFDYDGLLDLAVSFSDSTNRLFSNQGDTSFVDVASVYGMDSTGYWSSVTWADPESEGGPDLYFARRNGANRYYNSLLSGNWLKVKLHGVVSSRYGIGARVRVKTSQGTVWRQVDGGNGSMSEPAALFSLGNASSVDSLTIYWPCGLQRDTTGVAINQVLTWFETDSVFPQVDSTTVYPDTTFPTGPYPIQTKITDNNFSHALLSYTTDYGETFSAVAMTDAGGDFYEGNIPGQSSGTRVFYYVTAVDSVGHKTRSPYFAPDSLYMFSVDDSVPAVDSLTRLYTTSDDNGPYEVAALASDNDSLRNVWLIWGIYSQGRLEQGDSAAMDIAAVDSLGFGFTASIPGQEIGSEVHYFIRAVDLAGNYTIYPASGPDSSYSFRVSWFRDRSFADTSFTGRSSGVSVTDYDLDGYPDIFLGLTNGADLLYRGTDSVFTRAAATVLGLDSLSTSGGWWGDYNNDRYPDLYAVNLSGANVLLSNDGDGTFTDITSSAGVGDEGRGRAASWVDFDNDGRLDLFVVNEDGADLLLCNNGDSTFTDTASALGLTGGQDAVGCAWADFDCDGDQDVYVVYYGAENRLYRQKANGSFEDVTTAFGIGGGITSAGAAWCDYDNDSRPDLFLVEQAEDRLYHQLADGSFEEIELSSDGLSVQPGGYAAAWGDFDNDGVPDLAKSRGEPGKLEMPAVLRGQGTGSFEHYTFETGITDSGEYRGIAWLDYDLDGRLDLLISNRAGFPRLYRNISTEEAGNYLRLSLRGTGSNPLGLGARVSAFHGGAATLAVSGLGTTGAGQSEPVVHLGLDNSSIADSVVIIWPSGMRQTLASVAAGQTINVTEPDTLYPRIASHDTIPDQFDPAQSDVRLSCTVTDRDETTTVQVRYLPSGQENFITASMTRDSSEVADGEVLSWWHFDMPALLEGTTNQWRIVATGSRGSMDSTATLSYEVAVDTSGPSIQFTAGGDTVVIDTTGPWAFEIQFDEQAGLNSAEFLFFGQTPSGIPFSHQHDTTFAAAPQSASWSFELPARPLGTSFTYLVTASDIQGQVDSLGPLNGRVGPRLGKSSLSPTAVNVTDLLRLVYIVLDLTARVSAVDTLGLDMNRDGEFDGDDLEALLNLWRSGSGTSLLASAGQGDNRARASLELDGSDVLLRLDTRSTVRAGLVEVELDADSRDWTLLPGRRLQSLQHVSGRKPDGSLLLFFFSPDARAGLPAGSGELFRLSVSADRAVQELPMMRVARLWIDGEELEVDQSALKLASELPRAAALARNIPNPFNPSTTISFSVPVAENTGMVRVRLDVFNIRGALIRRLADEPLPPGHYRVQWNGDDAGGRPQPSGVYFYRLTVPGRSITRKMILLK